MDTSARMRVRGIALVVASLLAACGSPAPSSTSAPTGSEAAPSSPGASAEAGLIPYDQATAVDAAQAEVDDVAHLREVAGIAALIGPAGPTVLKNVDDAKVENAKKMLPEVAKLLGLDLSAADRRIASIQVLPGASRARDDIEWTGSLLGQVSATTSMMMALLPTAMVELAGRSEGTRPGAPIDKVETYPGKTHDGVTEQISIRTRVRITAGGGKVTMDLDINSVDTISDQATGAEIERLEGNAHGHIDVNACPDRDGVSPGSYELSLQEELVRPGSSGAGDAKVVKAPFSFVDGDDAHLVRIEGNLNITQHAHGPGTNGGDAFNWSVGAGVSEVILANGSSTVPTPSVQTDGDPSQAQIDNTTGGRQTAENYLKVLAKEAEKFWRSGKCIDLKPSDDTRKVKPSEKIDLTVEAIHQFTGDKVASPITATFAGTKSLDPKDQPVDPPAKFSFEAGDKKDDKGTIDLKQTSKRGIGKRQIVFTVDVPTLQAKIDATVHQNIAGNVYDTAIHLPKLDLTAAQDGTSIATGTVNWTTTYKPPTAACETKTYTGTFKTEVTARLDPDDPTRVMVIASFIPGVLKPEILKCTGKSFPFNGGTSLGVWASIAATEHAVTIGGSLTLHPASPGGTASVTINITKKNP